MLTLTTNREGHYIIGDDVMSELFRQALDQTDYNDNREVEVMLDCNNDLTIIANIDVNSVDVCVQYGSYEQPSEYERAYEANLSNIEILDEDDNSCPLAVIGHTDEYENAKYLYD